MVDSLKELLGSQDQGLVRQGIQLLLDLGIEEEIS